MTDKKKPHTAGTGTASGIAFDKRNHTAHDPMTGCDGRVDGGLLANILMAVVLLLIAGVVYA